MAKYFLQIGSSVTQHYQGSLRGAKIKARKEACHGERILICEQKGDEGVPICDNYERLSDGSFWYSNKKWRNL